MLIVSSNFKKLILESVFIENIIITETNIFELFIKDRTAINNLSIYSNDDSLNCDSITIYNSEIDKLQISKVSFTDGLHFYHSGFKEIEIYQTEVKNLINFTIHKCEKIVLRDVKTTTIQINLDYFSPSYRDVFDNDIAVKGMKISNVNPIEDKKRIEIGEINLESVEAETFQILSEFKETNIDILNINQVNNLILFEINANYVNIYNNSFGDSKIINCKFNHLQFHHFKTTDSLIFFNQNINHVARLLSFEDSDMSNVTFNPSFFHKFQIIRFLNSSIQNLKLFNFIDIPEKSVRRINGNKDTNFLTFYRELKGLAQNYGDNYLYHKFKALEYNERIRGWTVNIFKSRDFSFKDYFILLTNKISNNHTTNPFISLGWIIYLISVYISIINFSTNSNVGYKLLYNYVDYFIIPFKFLISIKDEILILEKSFSKSMFFIDIVYNIILSYLIYQMIAAFRKFNR